VELHAFLHHNQMHLCEAQVFNLLCETIHGNYFHHKVYQIELLL
jgi:hypothetical protein